MYRIASTISLALLCTPAFAAPASPTSASRQMAQATPTASRATAEPTAATPAAKKICKQLPSSYSHSSQRVCLTKDEWKQVDDEMRNN